MTNLVVGILIFVLNGNVVEATGLIHAPDVATCKANLDAIVKKANVDNLPKGTIVIPTCVDVSGAPQLAAPALPQSKDPLPKEVPHSNVTEL